MKLSRFAFLGLSAAALTAVVVLGAANASADVSPVEDGATVLNLSGDGFEVVVERAQVSVGKEGSVTVSIKAKPGYKVNDKYPHKIKFTDVPEGVTLPKMLKKKDGAFEGKGMFTFKIPVSASKAGEYSAGGKLKFSVCNDKSCLIQKKDIKIAISAS